MTRPTEDELEAWLTPWGYPPPGDGPLTWLGRDGQPMRPTGWLHSHPCPQDPATGRYVSIVEPGAGSPKDWPDHGYRWSCPHEHHDGELLVPPALPRLVRQAVWGAEHSSVEDQ